MGCCTVSTHTFVELVHLNYIWHDGALRWQTPDIGEQMVAGMAAMTDQDFASIFAEQGMTPTVAALISPNDHFAYTVEDMRIPYHLCSSKTQE